SAGPNNCAPAPSPSQVTVSNPCLNSNYLGNNNHGGHTCGSCSSRRNPNNVHPQAFAPIYCSSCSRDTDQTKCPTAQRTPTPPLLLSPSEVVYDPNLDPYLAAESPMLFSFKSGDGKEKKEKKEVKDGKKNKLFSGSISSSQSKDKDSA